MYKIIKAVIEYRKYKLEDMITKLNTFWAQDEITEAEHAELMALAREKALPENSYAGLQQRIDMLYKELQQNKKELEEVKTRLKALESDGTEEDEPIEDSAESAEYPEYVAPTGAHDAYYTGARVTYKGKKYICIAPEGVVVVWDPDVMPSYWADPDAALI